MNTLRITCENCNHPFNADEGYNESFCSLECAQTFDATPEQLTASDRLRYQLHDILDNCTLSELMRALSQVCQQKADSFIIGTPRQAAWNADSLKLFKHPEFDSDKLSQFVARDGRITR